MSMNVNVQTVRTLFATELRMVVRDRRILLTSILLPILIMPLMLAGSHWTVKRRAAKLREATYRFAVGGENPELVREFFAAANDLPTNESVIWKDELPRVPNSNNSNNGTRGSSSFQKKSVVAVSDGPDPVRTSSVRKPKFEEVKTEQPIQALQEDKVDVVLEGYAPNAFADATNATLAVSSKPPTEVAKSQPKKIQPPRKKARQIADDDAERAVPGAPVIRIIFRADRDFSSTAASRAGEALREARRTERAQLLRKNRFPVEPRQIATFVTNDVASKRHVAGLGLGKAITLLLVFLMLTSGSVVATDSIAGEKERGTLETLLTTSAGRTEIIAAKMLLILAVALTITLIQSANLLLYVGLKLVPVSSSFAGSVTVPIALLLFVLFLPVAALAGGVLLMISGYANTYKEAQMYFFPVFLVGLVPATAPLFPGLSLHSVMALLPVANIALSAREILTGNFDWQFITLSWVVTAATAAWTTSRAIRSLSAEKLITGGEAEAADIARGPYLFSRHVLRWFAVLWAVLLIVNNYVEKVDLRLQLVINLVVLFFGASCLMIRRYHLNIRETLSLRLPKLAVWLGVLIAVPGGLIAASGFFKLINYFIPVSSKLAEQFDEAIFPPNVGLWQLLFFLAVMPGFFEEITFRGLLLYGLRRRFRPIPTVLLVGIIFGLFHVALFRLAPTALLGIMLAAVTVLTGSIFPAMLWHALSNAASVFAAKGQLPLSDLEPGSYLIGAVMLVCAFWIFWRNRR